MIIQEEKLHSFVCTKMLHALGMIGKCISCTKLFKENRNIIPIQFVYSEKSHSLEVRDSENMSLIICF